MGKMGELVGHRGRWVVSMTACGYKFSASEWLQPAAAGQMIDSQDWCIATLPNTKLYLNSIIQLKSTYNYYFVIFGDWTIN